MLAAVAFDAALFAVFAFHHSVFARESVKAHLARVLPERLLRSFYVWTASLLLLLVLASWQPVAGEVVSCDRLARLRACHRATGRDCG